MNSQARVHHPVYNRNLTEVEGFDSLAKLTLDMRWSWNQPHFDSIAVPLEEARILWQR